MCSSEPRLEKKSYIDRNSACGFKSVGAVANGHLWFQIRGYGCKAYFVKKNCPALRDRTKIYNSNIYAKNSSHNEMNSSILLIIAGCPPCLKMCDLAIQVLPRISAKSFSYCSYLNSIVAMVFRQYMSEKATYDPGVLVIDSPLLGLDQGVSDAAPESMRTGLFKFFTKHQDIGQIIILENIRHIPDLDYEGTGANVITFTKGLTEGRYGFLNDVK